MAKANRRMVCPACGKTFKRQANWRYSVWEHISDKHTSRIGDGCWCGIKFWGEGGDNLQDRIRQHFERHGGLQQHYTDFLMGACYGQEQTNEAAR